MVFNLSLNENPYRMPLWFYIKLFSNTMFNIGKYPNYNLEYGKDKIAKLYGVEPSNILYGNGATDLIRLVYRTLIDIDDEILIPEITFYKYKSIAETLGRIVKPYKLDGLNYNIKNLIESETSKTKLVCIINPNNPTGQAITDQNELQGVIEHFCKKNIFVLIDEAYIEYVVKGINAFSIPKLVNKYENLLVVRSFSKFFSLAGLRLGYLIANKNLIERLYAKQDLFSVNTLGYESVNLALENYKKLSCYRERILNSKKVMIDKLLMLDFEAIDTQTNFILIKYKDKTYALYEFLLRNGFITKWVSEGILNGYIRITISKDSINSKLLSIIRCFCKQEKIPSVCK